jgi:hypothetical protein
VVLRNIFPALHANVIGHWHEAVRVGSERVLSLYEEVCGGELRALRESAVVSGGGGRGGSAAAKISTPPGLSSTWGAGEWGGPKPREKLVPLKNLDFINLPSSEE